MLTLVLLLMTIRAYSITIDTSHNCDGLLFNNVYYDKQMLFNQYGETYNLLMHPTGYLFFSHIVDSKNKTYGVTVCNMKTMICKPVKGVQEGYVIAYDQGNDKIYFGGKGIYNYNFKNQHATYFGVKYKRIIDLSIGRNFYFVEYPTKKLYIYRKGVFVLTNNTENMEIEKFYVSTSIKIYFTNKTGLFKVDKPYRRPRTYVLSNVLSINQITEDLRNRVFFCATDGIYIEDIPNHRVQKLADIDHPTGFTFDENQRVIYSDKYGIYRLIPRNKASLCFNNNNKSEDITKEILIKSISSTLSTRAMPVTISQQIERRYENPEFIFRGSRLHF